jgi:hypothetical protein
MISTQPRAEVVAAIARVLYREDYPASMYPSLSKSALLLEYEHQARVALEAVDRYREAK